MASKQKRAQNRSDIKLKDQEHVKPSKYTASIFPAKKGEIPKVLVELLQALEKSLGGGRLFLLLQKPLEKFDHRSQEILSDNLAEVFFEAKKDFPKKPITVLMDSPGGFARPAYKIASLLRNRCGGFDILVPRYAKSAATLFCLGANRILISEDAELGPLDVQISDPDREMDLSALDEVQSLDRLHAFTLQAIDQTMIILLGRTHKKIGTLLPVVLEFVTTMTRPLFEKIDTVHYTQMSRVLKVAEEYAVRLLENRYSTTQAEQISRHLVEHYPEHGFILDFKELQKIDPNLCQLVLPKQQAIIDKMVPYLGNIAAVGFLKQVG